MSVEHSQQSAAEQEISIVGGKPNTVPTQLSVSTIIVSARKTQSSKLKTPKRVVCEWWPMARHKKRVYLHISCVLAVDDGAGASGRLPVPAP